MPAILKRETIERVVSLKNQGHSIKEIANLMDRSVSGIGRILHSEEKRIKDGKPTPEEERRMFCEKIANARLNFSPAEVALQFGISLRRVFDLTKGHRNHKVFKRGLPIRTKPRKKNVVKKKDVLEIDQMKMEKGFAKVHGGEKIFDTKQPTAMRSVPMYDNKNTIKFVDLDDPRSNEEIRSAWKEEQERKLRSLAS